LGADHSYLEFLVSAFQSYLWNEVARDFLRRFVKDGFELSYFLGKFYFYHKMIDRYKSYQIPIINHKTVIDDRVLLEIYDKVLGNLCLSQRSLRIKWPERLRVKSFNRSLISWPNFSKVDIIEDKYFPGKRGLLLGFSLSAGSYATLLIKRLIGPKAGLNI